MLHALCRGLVTQRSPDLDDLGVTRRALWKRRARRALAELDASLSLPSYSVVVPLVAFLRKAMAGAVAQLPNEVLTQIFQLATGEDHIHGGQIASWSSNERAHPLALVCKAWYPREWLELLNVCTKLTCLPTAAQFVLFSSVSMCVRIDGALGARLSRERRDVRSSS